MALIQFPKAFGLRELKKGFFPHLFNVQAHQEYVRAIPAVDHYDPQGMSPDREAEFDAWHRARVAEQYHFHFRRELLAYCQSDILLLKEGCMKFQAKFQTLANLIPLSTVLPLPPPAIGSSANSTLCQIPLPPNRYVVGTV